MEKLKSSTFKKLSIVLCVLITVSFVVGIVIFKVSKDNKSVDFTQPPFQKIDNSHIIETSYGGKCVDNRIIVFFKSDVTEEQIKNVLNSIDGKVVGYYSDKVYQIEIPKVSNYNQLELIIESVFNMDGVFTCQEESIMNLTVQTVPKDPWKDKIQGIFGTDWDENNPDGLNWWLESIKAPSAWDYNKRFSRINIGIVDNGFDSNHEDIKLNIINPQQNANERSNGEDIHHGTSVAGIIGATPNNRKGITGIVWKKELYCADVMATKTQEENNVSVLEIFYGIDLLLKKGCKVINMSICNQSEASIDGEKTAEWILHYIEDENIDDFLIIQAAGNSGEDSTKSGLFASITNNSIEKILKKYYKITKNKYTIDDIFKHLIVVGSVGKPSSKGEYTMSDFSCYGKNVSIVAPGEDIFTTIRSGGVSGNYGHLTLDGNAKLGIGRFKGTSLSAPMVTGVASLVWSVNPDFTAKEVNDIVCNSTDTVAKDYRKDSRNTYPLVNAKLAVEKAIEISDKTSKLTANVKDKERNKSLTNLDITVRCSDNTYKIKTDENGFFKIRLPIGKHIISVKNNLYHTSEEFTVNIEKNVETVLVEPIYLTRKTGTLKATVKDKTNGKPIPNVSVKVVDMLTENADEVATVKTDKNGVFSVKLPYGNYSLYFTHDDYKLDNDTNREDVIVSYENNSLAGAILLTPKVPKLTNVIYRYDDIIDEYRIKCLKDKAHETYEVTRLCCCSWTLIDINNDGTDELIIETGTCEADRKYHVYTYKNEKIVKLDEFYAFHCSLYKYNGQILMYQWYMGDVDKSGPWELCSLNIKNGDLTVDNIKSGQPGEEPDERWFNSQIEFNDLFMTCDYEIDLPNKENDIRYILNTASGILSKWKHGSYKAGEGVLIYDEKIKSEFYYYRINYDGIDSVSDLRKYLKNYFDDNICDEIIKGGYMTHYVDYNGHLYCSEIDEPFGTFLMYQLDKIEIKEQVGNTATVSLEYLASNGYEIFEEENRQIEQKIKYVNGKWILADKCNLLY